MQNLGEILPFILAFAAVVLLVFGIGSLVPTTDAVRRRLAGDSPDRQGRRSVLRGSTETPWLKTVISGFVRPDDQDRDGQLSPLRLRLVRAGFFSPYAPAAYHALRAGLAIALIVPSVVVIPLLMTSSTPVVALTTLIFGVLGYVLPTIVVHVRTNSRARLLRESFPDALDMLLMCVEAGVGLDESIARVGDELKRGHPLLAWHFDLLSAELRAGKNRDAAFRALSDRIGIDEVQSFVALIVQTEVLGTSMADTLRSMSDDMRQRRLLRAEEMAQKVSTKLSMVLMTFVLPVLLMVIIAPAISRAVVGLRHLN